MEADYIKLDEEREEGQTRVDKEVVAKVAEEVGIEKVGEEKANSEKERGSLRWPRPRAIK